MASSFGFLICCLSTGPSPLHCVIVLIIVFIFINIIIVAEQDWLNVVYQTMDITQTNFTAAHDWLHAMGDAAASLGITIQYCMSLPIHMLESTSIQAVTNSRASGEWGRAQTP